MKIILPSRGVLGAKSVDMRQPTYNDIRRLNSLAIEGERAKVAFTEWLLAEGTDLNAITRWDLDYLFTVAAMAVQLQAPTYECHCPQCNKKHKGSYSHAGQELIEYKGQDPLRVKGLPDAFHLLSAQNHKDALEYAAAHHQDDMYTVEQREGESVEQVLERQLWMAYEDAATALTYGRKPDSEGIAYARQLDVVAYLRAAVFQRCFYHGLESSVKRKCECGHEFSVNLSPTIDLVAIDTERFMKQFATVRDVVSFQEFAALSVPEFKALVNSLQ